MSQSSPRLRFALYIRKSSESEDRQILSIGSQLDTLLEYARKNECKIIETFQDSASAHKINNRPGFNQ